eukprot:scaffold24364_cov70-Phaeocystis_antarctica.AAC.4
MEVGCRNARPLLKHGVRPEFDQVPIEDLRRLNGSRAVHPRAECAQDVSQDRSAAETFKCRLELCVYDSAAPPSKLREHWPAVRCVRRAQPPDQKPLQADGNESDVAGDE